ncbi:MAG: hypothetical protein JOZ62_05000, partial [Acidobacteriaceae bacterium]|nr:hypothetical protein [Acidobacteriaceae bacterium]
MLDDREDYALYKLLSGYDLAVERTRLDFADLAFEGIGPGNHPVMVGIERKHMGDLAQCVIDRRLSGHQLKGMAEMYDYCYLLIEDQWRPDQSGGIEVYRGGRWTPLYA